MANIPLIYVFLPRNQAMNRNNRTKESTKKERGGSQRGAVLRCPVQSKCRHPVEAGCGGLPYSWPHRDPRTLFLPAAYTSQREREGVNILVRGEEGGCKRIERKNSGTSIFQMYGYNAS